jgi:hypothetical protein
MSENTYPALTKMARDEMKPQNMERDYLGGGTEKKEILDQMTEELKQNISAETQLVFWIQKTTKSVLSKQ